MSDLIERAKFHLFKQRLAAAGYQYGDDAASNAFVGWELAQERISELEARDRTLLTKQGTFKGSGDPALDACLQASDPEFQAAVHALPANYWARYDLSAVRLGWHMRGQDTLSKSDPQE